MATFVANARFSIDAVDLGFYGDNFTSGGFEEDGSFAFQGATYPDYFYISAANASASLRLDIYGRDIVVTQFGTITAGTINAVGEFDVSAGSYRWYVTGIAADAKTTFDAAFSDTQADDLAVIQNALASADTITLSPFADVMGGYGGNDFIDGGQGNDILDGGSGSDTAFVQDSFAQATISFEGDTLVLTTPTDGTDRLTNFEFVSFNGDVRTVESLVPQNDAPIPVAATASATEDGAVVTGQLQASDPDGDTLTFTAGSLGGLTVQQNGAFSFDPSNVAYQSLKSGETKDFVVNYSVSDGIVSGVSTLTITVTGVNDAPAFALTERELQTDAQTALEVTVAAIDVDGDVLTYSASGAENGTVTGGNGGVFVYTPDAGFSGEDEFVVTASDPDGEEAMQTIVVTVIDVNAAPVIAATGQTFSTGVDMSVSFTVSASDADGDSLTYIAADPANGAVTGGENGQFVYTPDSGFIGTDAIEITVSDGNGGTAMATYTVDVLASVDNLAPIIETTVLSYATLANTPRSFTVVASDPDGDALSFSASDPANGTITGGAGGQFVYTPDQGFTGTDSFTVTVVDEDGAFDSEEFSITVSALFPAVREYSVLASAGFVGTIGGYGQVFGTRSNEDITILDQPGTVALDPSFNSGGDILRLPGDANAWQIVTSGTGAVLSSGDIFVSVPAGIAGAAIVFDDGVRILKIDTGLGSLVIGDQAFGAERVQITAAAQDEVLPGGTDPDASAQIVLQPDGSFTGGGMLSIVGTSAGSETVDLLFGEALLDPSFNRGGDLLLLDFAAESFTANVQGTNLFLQSDTVDVSIPVGTTGMTVEFAGEDARLLEIDTQIGMIVLGDQPIGMDPIALAAAV